MKIRMLIVLLCTSLLLTACAAIPAEKKEPRVKAVYDELPEEHSYYQYGNMQKASAGAQFARYGDKVFFLGNVSDGDEEYDARLYFYDLNTGEVHRFCTIPDCDHTSLECKNTNTWQHNLEYYDGKLYAHRFTSSIRVLEDNQWESLEIYETAAWHAYGDLFTMKDGVLRVYYEGKGEPRKLLYNYYHSRAVVFGRYMYSADPGELTRVDLLADDPSEEVLLEGGSCMVDGEHIYYIEDSDEKETFFLYRFDMNGKNRKLLLAEPVLPASLNFDDEYIYFRLYTDKRISGKDYGKEIYRMSKEDPTQIVKIATLPETAYQIFTVPGEDEIFVTTWGAYKDGYREKQIYMVKRDGKGWARLELP